MSKYCRQCDSSLEQMYCQQCGAGYVVKEEEDFRISYSPFKDKYDMWGTVAVVVLGCVTIAMLMYYAPKTENEK